MIVPLINNSYTETFNTFFQNLLKKKVVDALLVPQAVHNKKSYAHTLVKDPAKIQFAEPFLPFLMTNGAKAVSALTAWDPGEKIGIVLRGCEIRTMIELAKFKQVNLDQVFLIGVDCLGTVESATFESKIADGAEFNTAEFLQERLDGKDEELRKSCQACKDIVPENVDMSIGFIGTDAGKTVFIQGSPEVLEQLGMDGPDAANREKAVAGIREDRKKKYTAYVADLKKRFSTIDEMLEEFARCKRCYNCRVECPICFCKECVFITKIFQHKPDQYLRWAERKGATKIPADTLLFHLTRLNHMVVSCVECGFCSSACPHGLPVYELFQYMANDVQAVFDYHPGESVKDDPPLNTFREKELESV